MGLEKLIRSYKALSRSQIVCLFQTDVKDSLRDIDIAASIRYRITVMVSTSPHARFE
jgi:hypothetical protein